MGALTERAGTEMASSSLTRSTIATPLFGAVRNLALSPEKRDSRLCSMTMG